MSTTLLTQINIYNGSDFTAQNIINIKKILLLLNPDSTNYSAISDMCSSYCGDSGATEGNVYINIYTKDPETGVETGKIYNTLVTMAKYINLGIQNKYLKVNGTTLSFILPVYSYPDTLDNIKMNNIDIKLYFNYNVDTKTVSVKHLTNNKSTNDQYYVAGFESTCGTNFATLLNNFTELKRIIHFSHIINNPEDILN